MPKPSLITPQILNKKARLTEVKIFLCGPGYSSGQVKIRDHIKDCLKEVEGTGVWYGEEIEAHELFRKKQTDLQSLEVSFAYYCDWTIVLLDSPGAMAEIGTFSQIKDISSRLMAVVPSRFYGDASYIARGPLSIITRQQESSVVYYSSDRINDIKRMILLNLTLYKFISFKVKNLPASTKRKFPEENYQAISSDIRIEYNRCIAYIIILSLNFPTFPDLVLYSGIPPKDLNVALRFLYKEKKIIKNSNGSYVTKHGFKDEILNDFNTMEISRMKARLLARNALT